MSDYQQEAIKSLAITQKGPAALAHRTLGLTGEAGILGNQVKKVVRDKDCAASEEDLAVIEKRLGDVLFYAAAIADYFDLDLSDVAKQNLDRSAAFRKNRAQSD